MDTNIIKSPELKAHESFEKKIITITQNTINQNIFYKGTLESIDTNLCKDDPDQKDADKHLILLYLHVEGNDFSKEFCTHLQNEEVLNQIEKTCYFVAWDLNDSYRKSLLNSVKHTLGFNSVYKHVSDNISSVFFMKPIDHEIIEEIDKTYLIRHFPFTLRRIVHSISSELEDITKEIEKKSEDISSERFQQTMYEFLGDRDFDSFEFDEHEHLKNKLYFAVYGSPDSCEKNEEREAVLDELYALIRKTNNKYSKWVDRVVISFVYNCTESTNSFMTNMTPIPLFVVRKCKGTKEACRRFVDLDLRVYETWRDYLNRNKLPKCTMIVPKNGRYQGDMKGNVLLETHRSPQSNNTARMLRTADTFMTMMAIIAAILMIVSIVYHPVMIPAGVMGLSCAFYSMGRTSYQLHDRRTHKMSMSIKNPDARGAYLNIAANSIGLIGGALTRTIAIVASRGAVIAKTLILTANSIHYAGLATDFVGIVNSIHGMKSSKRADALQILQLSVSILFFNNGIINLARTQGQLVHAEIHASIKIKKMSSRQPSNTQTVSHLRSVHSCDLMKVLGSRSNRLSTTRLIKFSGTNGKIYLNDVPVMVLKQTAVKFQGMSLPPVQQVTEIIQKKFLTDEEDVRLYADVLVYFANTTKESIFKIAERLLEKLKEEEIEYKLTIKRIFPHSTYTCKVLEVIVQFLEEMHVKESPVETEEENRLKFYRMIEAIDLDEILIDLVQFYLNWVTTAIYEFELATINRIKRREMQQKDRIKIKCELCNGHYYKNSI